MHRGTGRLLGAVIILRKAIFTLAAGVDRTGECLFVRGAWLRWPRVKGLYQRRYLFLSLRCLELASIVET